MVNEHNSDEDRTFDMGINKFSDMTEEEFYSGYTGLRIPAERAERMANFSFDQEVTSRRLSHSNEKSSDLPAHKNWYLEGYVTRPYDQNGCGACWAFSTAAAVESLAAISGYDKEVQEYSIQ